MSQRNPMNERYTNDKKSGATRKSAASAKPKAKAAASVTMGTKKKTSQERKAAQKAARKEEAARQKELDRKYYKPDTEQYKKLRRIWWLALIGAVVCTAGSWFLRGVQPDWLAMACLFAAYALIIFAFYIDFSKIRKERRAYQQRMVALEREQEKRDRPQQRSGKQAQGKKGSSGGATHGKEGKDGEDSTADAKGTSQESADQEANEASKKTKKRLWGKSKDRNAETDGTDASASGTAADTDTATDK